MGDDRQSKPTALMGSDQLATLVRPEPRAHVTPARGSDRIARERIRPAAPTVPVDLEEISGLIEMAEVMVQQKPADVVVLDADDKKTREMAPEQFRALLQADQRAAPVSARAVTKADPETTTTLAAQSAPPRNAATTAELMAQVDDAFGDFGPDAEVAAPVEAAPVAPLVETVSKPVKKPALIVPDHRLDTRFAGGIAPITKPPPTIPPATKPIAAPVEETPPPPATKPTAAPVEETPPAPSPIAPVGERSRAPSQIQVAQDARSLVYVSVLAVAILVAIALVLLR